MTSPPRSVRFGVFELDRQAGELTKAGRRLHLTPQSMRLLTLLVDRAGEVVTRDQIRLALWGEDTFVDYDAAMNACISQIRTALGDSATSPRFVETLPRRGYRFITGRSGRSERAGITGSSGRSGRSEITGSSGRSGRSEITGRSGRSGSLDISERAADDLLCDATAHAAPVASPRVPYFASLVVLIASMVGLLAWQLNAGDSWHAARGALAVLPIDAPADDRDLVALGNMLQERALLELHQRTAGRSEILARPAVESFRGTGRSLAEIQTLGPAYFVDATLQRVGAHVRLHAKVARARDLRILWIDDFELPARTFVDYRDRFAAELAERLLEATMPRPDAPIPLDEGAPELTLSGTLYLGRDNQQALDAAIDRLERAVAAAPGDLVSRSILARALTTRAIATRDAASAGRAREQIATVLGRSPSDPGALGALGALQFWIDRDFAAGGRHLQKAIDSGRLLRDVQRWHSAWLTAMGRHDEAIAAAGRIESAAPVTTRRPLLARALFYGRRYAEAARAADATLALNPGNTAARVIAYMAAVESGNAAQTLDRTLALLRMNGGDPGPSSNIAAEQRLRLAQQQVLAMLARSYAEGQPEAAYDAAVISAHLGDSAAALDWLGQAVAAKLPIVMFAGVNPAFDRLRGHPEFAEALAIR